MNAACEHRPVWDEDMGYCCVHCGQEVCRDCGMAPSWPYSEYGYCKFHHAKNGHPTGIQIDRDLLVELVGREAAELVFAHEEVLASDMVW